MWPVEWFGGRFQARMKGSTEMMTSNSSNLDQLTAGMSPVWIARGHPRCKGGWKARLPPGIEGRSDSRLAPTWAALKATDAEYDRAFAEILAGLDPARVYAELGENAVLLCFCEIDVWCHRRVVAEWFEYHLGVVVPELGQARDDTYVVTTKAYPFYVPPAKKLQWIEEQMEKDGTPAAAPELTTAAGRRQTWNPTSKQWQTA